MYNKNYISIFFICLMTFLSFSVLAQDKGFEKKNFSEDLLKVYNPWIATNNYSGLYLFNQKKISEFLIGYNKTEGDYARSMDPGSINKLTVGTYSYQKYKNVGLFGKFEYINSKEDDVNWCDVMNPYNGNPFIIGDKIGGDYSKELFHMAGGIASSLFGTKSSWGIGIDYFSGTGGKDNDPRPLNKIVKTEIKPGLLFNFNNFQLGFNFVYSYNKEEIEIKAFVNNDKYYIYKFRGLGVYSSEEKSIFDRNYFSNLYGGNMQIGFKIGNVQNVTELGFSYKKENIEDEKSEIKDYGLYEEENISFKSNFICKTDNLIHNIIVSGNYYDRIGTFNIVRQEALDFVNSWVKYAENKDYTNELRNLSLNYSLYKMNSKYHQNWKMDFGAEYFDNNKKYKFDPDVFEEDYQGIDLNFAFTKNFSVSKKSILAINLNGGYTYNLDNILYILDESNIDGLLIDDINVHMIEDMVITDNQWATADVVKLGGFVKFSFDTNISKGANSAYFKLAADYLTVNTGMFDGENRTSLTGTVGIVF